MRLILWLQQLSHVQDEPAVDRRRKDLMVPMMACFAVVIIVKATRETYDLVNWTEDKTYNQRATFVLYAVANVIALLSLIPALVYVLYTRRITLGLCEFSVLGSVAAVIIGDAGFSLYSESSIVYINVVMLDALLVCQCRQSVAKVVVAVTAAWMFVRAVLMVEDVAGACNDSCVERFSGGYFARALTGFALQTSVFVADFHFTRGFATSMAEQKALVEASVRVSEAAAVRLSNYETEATLALLDGPDAEQLPPLLRSALLQLVGNLALYRPYLPQSCFPGNSERARSRDGSSMSPVVDKDVVGTVSSHDADSSRHDSRSDSTSQRSPHRASSVSTQRAVPRVHGVGLVPVETAQRRVSLAAVNSKGSLRRCGDKGWADLFVRTEVETFVGAVAPERGVVDLVSGDHLFASFNASRLCTTHRVSAARVIWSMTERQDGGEEAERSAVACSGRVLCGDFGAAEMRRFMVLGETFNLTSALERVAARMGAALMNDCVGADADVGSYFFSALAERLCFTKGNGRPFLLWRLVGKRAETGGVDEWMYELDRRAPNPYEAWNERMHSWLHFGAPAAEADLEQLQKPFECVALTREREQSYLYEAGAGGGTVAFPSEDVQLEVLR